MWAIIEGTDYAGKSTLVGQIYDRLKSDRHEIERLHRSKPAVEIRRAVLRDYVLSVEPETEEIHSGKVLLSDRWHFGEATYAPLKRPHTDKDGFGLLGVPGWRWTELFLLSRGARTFWLRQPLEILLARSDRGDDYVKVEELGRILDLYHSAMAHSPTLAAVLEPNPGDLEMESTVSYVIEICRIAEQHARFLRDWPEYVGSPSPRTLIVGDRRNVTREYGEETKLPFMPVAGNSGDYLLSALPDPFWRTVGLANGVELNGRLRPLWEALGKPPIVALGRFAERTLASSGIDVEHYLTLPHPQYVRRFHHASRAEYGTAIEAAATTREVDDEWRLS